jgi:hypothetical protein
MATLVEKLARLTQLFSEGRDALSVDDVIDLIRQGDPGLSLQVSYNGGRKRGCDRG